jgi:hypothetical protein
VSSNAVKQIRSNEQRFGPSVCVRRPAPELPVQARIIVGDARIEATDAQAQFTARRKGSVTSKIDSLTA